MKVKSALEDMRMFGKGKTKTLKNFGQCFSLRLENSLHSQDI